jgi:hypothetical protein
MKKKGMLFCALFALVLLFTAAPERCQAESSEIFLPAGRIQLPENTRIVEIDVLSLLSQLREFYSDKSEINEIMAVLGREDVRYLKILSLFESLTSQSVLSALEAINFYMIGIPDGGNNYTAWFFTMKSNQETEKFLPDVFKGKMTEQKKSELLAWHAGQKKEAELRFPSGEKIDFAGSAKKIRYFDLFDYAPSYQYEWQPLEFIEINKKPALSAGVRINGVNNGTFSAFYVKQYIFGIGKKPALLAIVTFDSERLFWERTFDRAMADGFRPAAR